eukprot:NODE_1018_length_1095_cov_19.991396_g707_i0.p1 GENE.NODE_1018_length_1095_cov_19.991396_g707_i0~~NODE_1018_length_1095_cov_19.991396_g707_i0.p1  ORF type:complete len:264 (+),score=74.46 NODE_1018_length_1095_cov_19.991396_g707_i0:30-794(+)
MGMGAGTGKNLDRSMSVNVTYNYIEKSYNGPSIVVTDIHTGTSVDTKHNKDILIAHNIIVDASPLAPVIYLHQARRLTVNNNTLLSMTTIEGAMRGEISSQLAGLTTAQIESIVVVGNVKTATSTVNNYYSVNPGSAVSTFSTASDVDITFEASSMLPSVGRIDAGHVGQPVTATSGSSSSTGVLSAGVVVLACLCSALLVGLVVMGVLYHQAVLKRAGLLKLSDPVSPPASPRNAQCDHQHQHPIEIEMPRSV